MDVALGNVVVAAAGAVGGYLLKYSLDKRGEAETRRFTDKREHYRNLILAIKSLAEGEREHEKLFWFENAFLWLYASDAVLRSANAVATILQTSPAPDTELNNALGKLLLAMRRDIGFASSQMNSSDFVPKSAP